MKDGSHIMFASNKYCLPMNVLSNLLEGQRPGAKKKSSIARSLW